MKKVYQTPECLAMLLADDDILTESQFTVAGKINGEGGYEDGPVINW